MIGIILVLGVVPRLSHLGRPYFLDFHAWRQADSAAFTHGYLVGSWNPLSPSVDRQPCKEKSAPFGRVEAELPIVPYLAALPLRVLGVRDASAPYLRAVSILVFVLGCFALFALVRELEGDALDGLFAVAAFCSAPLAIFFTRSPQPDGQSLSVAIASVLCLARYLNHGRARDAWLTCACLSALLLMKISNAYLGVPLAYLVLSQRGARAALRDLRVWIVAIVACAAAVAWYWHAHSFAWSFGIWAESPHDKKFASVGLLQDFAKWKKLAARLRWDILTASGCGLTLLGIAARSSTRCVRVAIVWLLSALVFVVVTMNAQLRHIYYQLCLIPPAALAQAAGMRWLWDRAALGKLALGLVVALHGAITASVLWGNSPHASVEGASYFTEDLRLREPIDALQQLLPADALFVTTERDPRLYWNSHHRGYFCDSKKVPDLVRCSNGTSGYLLLGIKARARLSELGAFRKAFEPVWQGARYSLYRRSARQNQKSPLNNVE